MSNLPLDTLTKTAATEEGFKLEEMQIDALLIVSGPDIEPIILTRDIELFRLASEDNRLAPSIASGNRHELQGWQIVRRSSIAYAGERVMYDCLAIRQGA